MIKSLFHIFLIYVFLLAESLRVHCYLNWATVGGGPAFSGVVAQYNVTKMETL